MAHRLLSGLPTPLLDYLSTLLLNYLATMHLTMSLKVPVRNHRGLIKHPRISVAVGTKRVAAGILIWPDKALRQSFASDHLAHFKNAAFTALDLGHHDSRITFAHYRELVKPKEAELYWNSR